MYDRESLVYGMQAMYIRVKRHKTTYFVTCDPTDTVLRIKQKLQSLIDEPANKQRLTLLSTDQILENSKTLAEQKVSWRIFSCFFKIYY